MDEIMEQPQGYTPPDFLIETATDPEGIHACVKYILPHHRYRANLVMGLLLLGIGPSMLLMGETALGIVALLVGVYSLIFFATFLSRVANNQVRKLENAYGTDTVPCQVIFWPQGIVVNNLLSRVSVNFRYEVITSLVRVGDYLTFRTRERKSVILRLTDVEDPEDLIAYFKSKCPGARCVGL